MKALHVAAEVFPLVKTGGLADVVAALPVALARHGVDTRLLLPGYPAVMDGVEALRPVADIGPLFGALRVRVLLGRLPGTALPIYVIDAPYLYRRGGGPYQDAAGQAWADNLQRFALLGFVAAHLAAGDVDDAWAPHVVHAHDWHAALACVYVAEHPPTVAATVFTVHNLAFQGLFPVHDGASLGLATRLMSPAGLEYHGQLSFMKAGLQFAHRVTTVSPTYAAEIATPEFGCGLDGVIRSRSATVCGILNGIDDAVWDPASDAALTRHFSRHDPGGKQACRHALQDSLGLERDDAALLVTIVSRLTLQKGMDFVLDAMRPLVTAGVQFAVQGTGDAALEQGFREAQRDHPGRVQVHLSYDEDRAHRLIAGADAIAVPSRFEPCGLTQMYGLRYGTLPIVRRVGGLADTVFEHDPARKAWFPGADADAGADANATVEAGGQRPNGFVFDAPTATAFEGCVRRALAQRRDARSWRGRVDAAMAQDLSWAGPAATYAGLYRDLAPGAA